MPQEDSTPHALVGRAGLVFAYVCFALSLSLFGGAIYYLPLTTKAKLFLAAAVGLLTLMFVFLAIATHLVFRPRLRATREESSGEARQKEVGAAAGSDAKGSHSPR